MVLGRYLPFRYLDPCSALHEGGTSGGGGHFKVHLYVP